MTTVDLIDAWFDGQRSLVAEVLVHHHDRDRMIGEVVRGILAEDAEEALLCLDLVLGLLMQHLQEGKDA